jgi:hypothetical protein
MGEAKHLERYGVGLRGSYLRVEMERQVGERVGRRGGVVCVVEGRGVAVERRGEELLVWVAVAYPNVEEGSL